MDAYVDYVLNKSVERVFNEFKRGFYKVCDRKLINIFQPEELRGVMLGSEEYDWDVFKRVSIWHPKGPESHSEEFFYICRFDQVVQRYLFKHNSRLCLHNEQNATYENGYHVKHQTIVAFWEVFEELSSKDKKAFLCESIK